MDAIAKAEPAMELTSTWTAYPSLLYTLTEDAQRVAFEDAACAQYCGRYQYAEAIFDSKLHELCLKPLLALQHADMLTSQGREHERINLLKLALRDWAINEKELKSVQLLLRLMLADAEFWAFGHTKAVLNLLPAVRTHIRSRGINNLSDVEIRCITLHHSIVYSLEQCFNFTGKEDKTIFLESKGDRVFELKSIRQALQIRKHWRQASSLMQLELQYTASDSDSKLKVAIQDGFQLCASMETCPQASLRFRVALLKKKLVDILSDLDDPPPLCAAKEYVMVLRDITGPPFSRWEDFCPAIAFDVKKTEVLKSEAPSPEKIHQIRQFIQDAESRNDYTKANQAYISVHDVAKHWLDTVKGKSEEPSALETFRAIGKSYFDFHDQKTRLAYYEGAALTDYLHTISVRFHDYSGVLKLVEAFEEKHPNFDVPNTQERLYDQAITAAKHLGMIGKQRQVTKQYQNWFLKCSFVRQGGGFSDEAISNPDFAFREIKEDSNDPAEWGSNAIRLMIRWAANEWDRGLLSVEDCSRLFGPGLGSLPQSNLAEYLRKAPLARVNESIYGTIKQPTNTAVYMAQYRQLLDWVLIPERLPSRLARLFALKIFLECRLYRVRESFRDRQQLNVEEALALEEETKALADIQKLEAAENRNRLVNQEDQEQESVIHITLAKVFAIDAVKSGLIDEAELISRASDCRALITRYHNSGDRLKEYHIICQLIRLTWQRYLHFKTAPEEVMPLVNEADKVFIEVRNTIVGLDAPDDLIARVKLSQDFSHREHHNFALAGRLRAFETYMAKASAAQATNMPIQHFQNLAFQSFMAFLYWAFRSKGRGFVDTLNLEIRVARALERSKIDSLVDSKSQTGSRTSVQSESAKVAVEAGLKDMLGATKTSAAPELISPVNETMVKKQQIDEMIQSLPIGVVIVDFLDLRYSPTTSFVAMIYRKGQMNLPTNVPNITMSKIDNWVKENLDCEREGQDGRLGDSNSLDKLVELSGLLEPLLRTSPKVFIQPNETVIFCPTGSLNRVPIHAIPVNGRPFIERNPVVYCQSLTILHWLWLKFRNREQTAKIAKTAVINPMPESWSDKRLVQSTKRVAEFARKLGASFYHGFDLQGKAIAQAVEGSTLFHYHGHFSYNLESALDSSMILNEKAFKAAKRTVKPKSCEYLTARDFFKIKLREPALAVIVGCGSGIATISNTDDVLGIPTALFYAGASSVVSTLWSIDDEDGAEFSKQFYAAIWEQRRSSSSAAMDERGGLFDHTIDLARAMQTAVVGLREATDRKERLAPYHWAAFTFNGFWFLPDHVVPNVGFEPSEPFMNYEFELARAKLGL